MQDGNNLKRDSLGPVDNHVIGKLRNGPEAHRQGRYVLPLCSHQGMFRHAAAGGDDFHFNAVGSFPVISRNEPLDCIEVFRCLRRELKRRIHPCGFDRLARRFRNISIAASPSINSPRSACKKPFSICAATASR